MDQRLNVYLEQRAHDVGYWIGLHFWPVFLVALVVVAVFFFSRRHGIPRNR